MAVRRLIALLCIYYCFHGLCEAEEEQARVNKDEDGKEVYLNALRCKLPEGSILYPIPDDYSKAFDKYTKREVGTTCCYAVKTRNDCCLDFEKNDTGNYNPICKCKPGIKCGSYVCTDDTWKVINKACYKAEEGTKSFDDAKKGCKDVKGKLMEQKDTKSIAAELLKDSKSIDFWIGATRKKTEKDFKFLVDKVEKIDLSMFAKKPAAASAKDECVSTVKASGWKWAPNACTDKKGYICEMKATVSE